VESLACFTYYETPIDRGDAKEAFTVED
jgi:hypothetical protein